MLDRRGHRGIGFAGHGGHGIAQPGQIGREGKGPQTPSSRTTPLAQAVADDGAFRVVTGNGSVLTVVAGAPVNFIAEKNQSMTAGHLGNFLQLIVGKGIAVGIGRIIEDHQAWTTRVTLTQGIQAIGTELPVIVPVGRQPVHAATDDAGLGRVGHPARRGDHQVTVVDQLQDEHKLLGARPDHDVFAPEGHIVLPVQMTGDGFLQRRQAFHRQIILLTGKLT